MLLLMAYFRLWVLPHGTSRKSLKKKKSRTFPLFRGVSERFTAKPILLFFLFVKDCKIDLYLAGEIHLNSYLKAM